MHVFLIFTTEIGKTGERSFEFIAVKFRVKCPLLSGLTDLCGKIKLKITTKIGKIRGESQVIEKIVFGIKYNNKLLNTFLNVMHNLD